MVYRRTPRSAPRLESTAAFEDVSAPPGEPPAAAAVDVQCFRDAVTGDAVPAGNAAAGSRCIKTKLYGTPFSSIVGFEEPPEAVHRIRDATQS